MDIMNFRNHYILSLPGSCDEVCLLLENSPLDPDSPEFAETLDRDDPLRHFRQLYHIPTTHSKNGEERQCIYMCGHSLGLQLRCIAGRVGRVMQDWAVRGVDCHFSGDLPATRCDQPLKNKMAELIGAKPDEISFMNGLTVNIHLLLGTFYRPTAERTKILMLSGGFHSDLYAVKSHLRHRNISSKGNIIFLQPRPGEHVLRSTDILKTIEQEGQRIALVFLEAVHYYTGQKFDMETITKAAHEQGCVVGWDLAHAVGNIDLHLHDWGVDFGLWCTYKYLNSGPGSVGGIFIHSDCSDSPAFQGWWGLENSRKFTFDAEWTPSTGADRFRLSNPSPLLCASVLANLEVFCDAGMGRLRRKARLLTGYLEFLLRLHMPQLQLITPKERGSQLSLLMPPFGPAPKIMESRLRERGVAVDVREPCVLRVTPVPLYNTFSDVRRFVHILKEAYGCGK